MFKNEIIFKSVFKSKIRTYSLNTLCIRFPLEFPLEFPTDIVIRVEVHF